MNENKTLDNDEILLIDLLIPLWKKKWWILFFALLGAVAGFGASKVIKKKYIVSAVIMPGSAESGLTSKLDALGGMGDLASLAGFGSGANQNTKQIINLLRSRQLAMRIAQEFSLVDKMFPPEKFKDKPADKKPDLELAVSHFLANVLNTQYNKKANIIDMTMKWHDSTEAAEILSRYLILLQDFLSSSQASKVVRDKIFIHRQLIDSRKKLLRVSKTINDFYGQGNFSTNNLKIDVDLGIPGKLPPTIENLRKNTKILKGKIDSHSSDLALVKQVPVQVYYEFLLKEKLLLEKLSALLAQQYELAKIQAVKDSPTFEIIDKPFPTKWKYSPKKRNLILIGFAMGLLFSTFVILGLAIRSKTVQKQKVDTGP